MLLHPNGKLKARIQEWKLDHPMYQRADPNYANKQKDDMLNHPHGSCDDYDYDYDYDYDSNSSHTTTSSSYNNNNNIRLSRFELMMLPQERQVLKIVKIRAKLRQERLDRRSRCCTMACCIIITTTILVLSAIFVAVKYSKALA